MLIEFDPVKDAGNRAKHGVALSLAAAVDWGFVDRGTARRIIILRRANRREVKHYVQHTEAPPGTHADPNGGPDHHGGGQSRS